MTDFDESRMPYSEDYLTPDQIAQLEGLERRLGTGDVAVHEVLGALGGLLMDIVRQDDEEFNEFAVAEHVPNADPKHVRAAGYYRGRANAGERTAQILNTLAVNSSWLARHLAEADESLDDAAITTFLNEEPGVDPDAT